MAEDQEVMEEVKEGEVGKNGDAASEESKARQVPYERLETVSKQNQELRKQLQELNSKVEEFSVPQQNREEFAKKKAAQEEFYKDPFSFTEKRIAEEKDRILQAQIEQRDLGEYQTSMSALKNSPAWNQETEDAMVRIIQKHNLQHLGRTRALHASYEAATGREWGDWGDAGYTTRKVKERLSRPSSTGSAKSGMMSPEDWKKLPLEELEKNPKKYSEQYDAWMASQKE